MARIAGVDLPLNKRVEIGLTYIYGIGQPTAHKIATALGLSPDTKIRDLTDDEVVDVLRKGIKKRRESIEMYAGKRDDQGNRHFGGDDQSGGRRRPHQFR